MFTLVRIISAALILGVSVLTAQEFQGEATYKTKRKVDIKMDSTNTRITLDLQKQMNEMLKKQFEKTFILSFNKEASVYKEDVALATPGSGISFNGISMSAIGGGGSDILYKNTKQGTFVNQKEVFGKIFLIKDAIEPIEWQLSAETKNIGEYTCYKATYTKEVEVTASDWGSNDETDESKTKTEIKTIIAWYTPQIPVSNGPAKYQGLPGLILECNDGDQQIVCSRIVINPEDKISIKQPKQGKEVSQSEFEKIMEKKMKEFQERYRPTGRENGETIQIRIGG